MPNCIQNTYITILRAITESNSITQILQIREGNICNVSESPNIQTTKLPLDLNISEFSNWFYIIDRELLVPALGYALGGSRADIKYEEKIFKSEDCSSALVKWLGSQREFRIRSCKSPKKTRVTLDRALSYLDNFG